MKVKLNISEDNKETYAEIFSSSITPEVEKAVNFIEKLGEKKDILPLILGEKTVLVKTSEIFMARVEDNSTVVYTEKEKYICKKRLYEVLENLQEDFMRISKTTIINLKKAKCVEPYFSGAFYISLTNGLTDYISRKYMPEFKKYLGI